MKGMIATIIGIVVFALIGGSYAYTIYNTDQISPTTIASGSNWINRTGEQTTAYELSQHLSHKYIWYFYSWGESTQWVQIIKYDWNTHQYGVSYLTTSTKDSQENFIINTGDTIFIGSSGEGKLYMEGWS